jgi:hypothetical protein
VSMSEPLDYSVIVTYDVLVNRRSNTAIANQLQDVPKRCLLC